MELHDLQALYATSSNMYLGKSSSTQTWDLGLRWQSLNIRRRRPISSAKLSLYLHAYQGALLSTIQGIAEDDAATWTADTTPSQRIHTTAVVTANEADWNNWGVGNWVDIDITEIVQEIIDRDGWSEHNALAIVLVTNAVSSPNYSTFRAYEYTGNAYGAKLEITYSRGTLPEIDIDYGLVLYLPLNDGSGTSARDDSGWGNIGTLQNMGDSNWVAGKSGDALDFNGSDEYVDCGGNACLDMVDTLTITAWVKSSTFSAWQTIVSRQVAATSGYYLVIDTDKKLNFGYRGLDTADYVSTETIVSGEWNFVAATFAADIDTVILYVNNIKKTIDTATGTPTVPTQDLNIGRYATGDVEFWNGLLDEVRVYDRALTDMELTWLYNHPSGVMGDIPSGRVCFEDSDGDGHTIADMQSLRTTTALTTSSDTVAFDIVNLADQYSWLEQGCEIEVLTGMGGVNTPKLIGFVTEVTRTLDSSGTVPHMSVHGESLEIRLNNILFSGRFYNIEVSALLIAIIDLTDFTTGETYRTLAGIDASNAHIDSTAYTIDEASYVWKSIGAAIKELAELVGFGWYVDTDAVLHFFDPTMADVVATITDLDLEGPPTISNEGSITNRAIVIGGFQQQTDQSGNGHPSTVTVTSSAAKNQSFVPTEDYMGSVLVYTELVTGSTSDILISVQADSASAPDGVYLSNSQHTIPNADILDADYSEFRFERPVTLTPGSTYWLVLSGTTGAGVKVGVDGSAVLDYKTRHPAQVAIMANDNDSYLKHGLYSAIHRDTKIEDAQIAETKAGEMLITASRKTASLTIRGDSRKVGEIVQLTLTTVGVGIDATMQIISSTQTVKDRFIYNNLEMIET